jgi:molybdopterin biosynthesis enzyme
METANLSLKEFDAELLRQVKAKAALSGVTLREYVTTVLAESVKSDFPQPKKTKAA